MPRRPPRMAPTATKPRRTGPRTLDAARAAHESGVNMPPTDLDADRAFCRDALQRVSRTFALNTRVLTGTLGESVRVGYLLCRPADALEDSWPDAPEAMRDRFERLLAAMSGDAAARDGLAAEARARAASGADLALVADLARVLRVYDALPAAHRAALARGVTTLARGMCRYATRGAARPAGAPYLDDGTEPDGSR